MSVPGSVRGAVAAARLSVLVVAGLTLLRWPAAADTTVFRGTNSPIVRVTLRQGDVTIRTWDREAVQIDGDSSLTIEQHTIDLSGDPLPMPIPATSSGPDVRALDLPLESFVPGPIPAGVRDVVLVHDSPDVDPGVSPGGVQVTVPSDAVFVFAATMHGNLEVHDYRAGTLVAMVGAGKLTLASVGGIAFAQTRRGPILVRDSDFDRVRARSLFGSIRFERCRVRQIEATTGTGSLIYEGGAFEPGLARFESERGNIAIGSDGPVQISAHAATDGHVFTEFGRAARVAGDSETDAQATVGNGGPVVTATSREGNVVLYDGLLRAHPRLQGQWRAPAAAPPRPIAIPHHPVARPLGRAPHAASRPRFESEPPFGARQQLRAQPGLDPHFFHR
jgi:hypothetical protein